MHMPTRKLASTTLVTLLACGQTAIAAGTMDPALRTSAQKSVDAGVRYLKSRQGADGSVLGSVGLTALSMLAVLENPARQDDADKTTIERYAAFIVSKANPDGSIAEIQHDQSYNTSVAITALAATGDPRYATTIANAQKFIQQHQVDETEGFKPVDNWYGGLGYGGDERPDISNCYIALEAMRATSYDPKDPMWQKALTFVTRMQNRSESNDQRWAGNDGGFAYSPGMNPPEMGGGTNSYASVTSAGLYSLLLIGVDKSDPRVQAAYKWLTSHFTLDSNFGSNTKNTLFYFYSAFAKVMAAYGAPEFVDGTGQRHNWRNELAAKLIQLQDADGSWVNRDSSVFWENRPELATSWSVLALERVLK
jgi:squalene-hopene/tetraprenyl-beta-curcumene cyclase